MTAFFALVFTIGQLALTALGYFTYNEALFSNMVVNGAPFYLIMNLFNPGSPLIDGKPLYQAFLAFHVVKYFCIFRGKIVDEYPRMAITAIFLEIVYLAISAYYLY